jgi:transcriptional regulator with GAF, ATPase, and Fis domain
MMRLSLGLTLIAVGMAVVLVTSTGQVDRIFNLPLRTIAISVSMIVGALMVVSAVLQILTLSARSSEVSPKAVRDDAIRLAILKDAHSRLLTLAISGAEISETLASGGPMLKAFVKHDMVSFAVVDDKLADMKRYSVSDSGNRILERGLSFPVSDTAIEQVVESGKASISGALSGIRYRDDAWLSKCGFRSRISVPVVQNNRVMGVLSFVSMSEQAYSDDDVSRASMLTDVFAVAIKLSSAEREMRSLKSHVTESWELLSRLTASGDIGSFQRDLVRCFTDTLPATCCRLSVYERRAGTLTCLAEHYRRRQNSGSDKMATPVRIDRMPWHNSAIRAGKVVVFNQSDGKRIMTDEEVGLGFPDSMRSGMIFPLKVAGRVRGIISVGEMREWKRRSFSSDDIACAEMMAAQASLAIAMSESVPRGVSVQGSGDISIDDGLLSLVNRRMVSPLSSILGATELLEKEAEPDEGKSQEYVAIIRRNVEKAVKALDEFRELRKLSDTGNNVYR